jgi:hypothetical protein
MRLIRPELVSLSEVFSLAWSCDRVEIRRRLSPDLVPVAGEALLEAGLPETDRSNDAASPALRLDPEVDDISVLERRASFCTEREPFSFFFFRRRCTDSDRLTIRWSISIRDSGRRYRGSLSSILWTVFCAEFLLFPVRTCLTAKGRLWERRRIVTVGGRDHPPVP